MAWSLIAHGGEALGVNGGTTSGAGVIDTSGADFIAVFQSYYKVGGPGTLTDSRALGWVNVAQVDDTAETGLLLWIASNANGGTSHTFTIAGTGSFTTVLILAFSGSKLMSPLDGTPLFEASVNSVASHQFSTAFTPAEDNELLLWGVGTYQTTPGCSSDIGTESDDIASVPVYSGAAYYQIQTTATARQPTISHASYRDSIILAAFKAAAGGGVTARHNLSQLGVG